MSDSFEKILEDYPQAILTVRKDGPPTFQGEDPHRMIISGNPEAFRLLASVLHMMADRVEQMRESDVSGWYFLVGSDTIPQLRLDPGHLLALDCDVEQNIE